MQCNVPLEQRRTENCGQQLLEQKWTPISWITRTRTAYFS